MKVEPVPRGAGSALAILGAVAIALAACVAPPAQAPAPGEQPQPGGRVVHGAFTDIKTLQPVLARDTPSLRIIELLYAPLLQPDANTGELRPNLGRWSVSADGLAYSWEIEAKATWSDGRPVVGEDYLTFVKAVARSKKTARKGDFADIDGFKAYAEGKSATITGITTDGKKLSVRFTKVFCPALASAFGVPPLPTHVFGKYLVDADPGKNLDDAPENAAPAATSGPFLFKEWRVGDQVILARNPNYWKGSPLLDEWVYRVVPDATVLAAELKTGGINYGQIEAKDLADIERQAHLKVSRYQQLNYTFIGWNVRSPSAPFLADRRVRQALTHGLDTDSVVKTVLFGQATKMVSHHPPASWAFPQSGMNPYPYDRSKAEELLRSAGYAKGADGFYQKDGKALGFALLTHTGNKIRETLVQIATEQYRLIGVKVTPKLESFESMVDKLVAASPEIEGWIIALSLGVDPDPFGYWHSSSIPDPAQKRPGDNVGGFTAPGLDQAIEQARTGDCSQAARKKHYETFNRILNEEQPYNFGFSPSVLLVTAKALQNVAPGPFGQTHNVDRWWLSR